MHILIYSNTYSLNLVLHFRRFTLKYIVKIVIFYLKYKKGLILLKPQAFLVILLNLQYLRLKNSVKPFPEQQINAIPNGSILCSFLHRRRFRRYRLLRPAQEKPEKRLK